jgi:protein-L-isoaspartate(D-aspartate) O-methyltransferase
MVDIEYERQKLIESLVRRKYISKPDVVRAMVRVPRHEFMPEKIRDFAYNDCPQAIGEGQTISAPHMVGIMVEKLDLRSGQKIFEVGGGSGYHAAVVAEVVGPAGHVYSMEYIEPLARRARLNIEKCGLGNVVTILSGDGSLGYPPQAPFDRIFVTCAAPEVPPPLLDQLADRGKMLVPAGGRHFQTLVYCEKKGDKIIKKDMGGCVFVPLRGRYGFKW